MRCSRRKERGIEGEEEEHVEEGGREARHAGLWKIARRELDEASTFSCAEK